MNDESIIHVQIEASTLADLRAFTDEIQPDLGCRPIARKVGETFVVNAYLPEAQLAAARDSRAATRIALHVVENSTEIGRERQKEVAEGDRFQVRGEVPRGLGDKE